MDIDQYLLRLLTAVGFGASAFIGLLLTGAESRVVVAVGCLVGALVFLNVLSVFARGTAALLLVWGALSYGGILPDAAAVSTIRGLVASMTQRANIATVPTTDLERSRQSLSDLCDRKILSSAQCASAKANLVAAQPK